GTARGPRHRRGGGAQGSGAGRLVGRVQRPDQELAHAPGAAVAARRGHRQRRAVRREGERVDLSVDLDPPSLHGLPPSRSTTSTAGGAPDQAEAPSARRRPSGERADTCTVRCGGAISLDGRSPSTAYSRTRPSLTTTRNRPGPFA